MRSEADDSENAGENPEGREEAGSQTDGKLYQAADKVTGMAEGTDGD